MKFFLDFFPLLNSIVTQLVVTVAVIILRAVRAAPTCSMPQIFQYKHIYCVSGWTFSFNPEPSLAVTSEYLINKCIQTNIFGIHGNRWRSNQPLDAFRSITASKSITVMSFLLDNVQHREDQYWDICCGDEGAVNSFNLYIEKALWWFHDLLKKSMVPHVAGSGSICHMNKVQKTK